MLQTIQGFDDPGARFEAGWVSGTAVASFSQSTTVRSPDATRRSAVVGSSSASSSAAGKVFTLGAPAAICVAGAAFKCENTSHSTSTFFALFGGGNVYLRVTAGVITVTYTGPSGEVTVPTTFAMDTAWHYLEVKAKFDAVSGIIEVRVDGEVIFSHAGATAAATNILQVYLNYSGNTSNDFFWDDVYVLDGTGAVNNDFLGDVQVAAVAPSAAGDETEWSSTGGPNWDAAGDPTFDYVFSDVVGETDLYNLASLGDDYEIFAVQPAATVYKNDAGTRTVDFVTKLAATEVTAPAGTLGTSSSSATAGAVQNLAPDGAAWDRTKFEALQLGVRVAS